MSGHPKPVPDLLLERYRLGELPETEADALRRRLDDDPDLRERLAALDRSDEAIRRRVPAALLAERVRSRLAADRGAQEPIGAPRRVLSPAWRWSGVLAAATLAAALSLRVLAPTPPSPAGPSIASESEADRIKGLRPALALYRKTARGSETLADGDRARAGDLIRVGYRSSGRRYGAIVSLDGRGNVTRHLPVQGGMAARLEAGPIALLTNAYELDDAPGWERFFFVTADTPFGVAEVEEAARRAVAGRPRTAPEALPLPGALEQSTFLLTKERRP